MAIYFIRDAHDYVGGEPETYAVMVSDSVGRWTKSTSPTIVGVHMTGTIDGIGVSASNVIAQNSVSTPGVKANKVVINTEFSIGNRTIYANASRFGAFSATPVNQQGSASTIKADWTSLHTNSSISLAEAVNGLATAANAINTALIALGFTL